jgi:hypothetical protein
MKTEHGWWRRAVGKSIGAEPGGGRCGKIQAGDTQHAEMKPRTLITRGEHPGGAHATACREDPRPSGGALRNELLETLARGRRTAAHFGSGGRKGNDRKPSARREFGPGLSARVKKKTERKSTRAEIKTMNTTKNSRFGTNTIKMQTRNFSMRSKQCLHPIHGGLRPPSLFLIGTKLGTLLI